MIVAVFRTRLRTDADMTALTALGERMFALATAMPGFVSYKDFRADDGESLTLVEFASERELLAWKDNAEHREAQERGRREFFTEYHVQVGRVDRAYRFAIDEGRSELL
jgi:heme-degrading monooxygenase HmoA